MKFPQEPALKLGPPVSAGSLKNGMYLAAHKKQVMGIIGRIFGVLSVAGSEWTLVTVYRSRPSENFILLAFLFFLTVLGLWLLVGAGISLFRALKDHRRLQH